MTFTRADVIGLAEIRICVEWVAVGVNLMFFLSGIGIHWFLEVPFILRLHHLHRTET